jgi:tetratricopeptide (TPR) repeat protein
LGKGNALAELARFDEAILVFDEAVKITPNHAMAWFAKGSAIAKTGRYQDAMQSLIRATEIEPRV